MIKILLKSIKRLQKTYRDVLDTPSNINPESVCSDFVLRHISEEVPAIKINNGTIITDKLIIKVSEKEIEINTDGPNREVKQVVRCLRKIFSGGIIIYGL